MTEKPPKSRRLPRHCIEDKGRDGTSRIYLRIRNKFPRKIRLHGTPGTPEFMARYERALAGLPPDLSSGPVYRIVAAKPATWRWLCQQYFASPEFLQLAFDFRTVRRQILEATFDEPTKPGSAFTFADCPIKDMTKKAVRLLRDRKLAAPEAANHRLKAIRRVFTYGLEAHEEIVLSNPARDVPYFKVGTDGYHPWTIAELQQYADRHPPGSMARRALCILFYTGVRRANAVMLGPRMVRDGILTFTVHKKRATDKPKIVTIPVLPELQAELARSPQNSPTWLTNAYHKPFTPEGFGSWFKDRCQEAGLEQCSAHGLRKAGATFAAENGATDAQLMAIFGWDTVKMAAYYRRNADQKRLARDAMKLIHIDALVTRSPIEAHD